MVTTVKVSCDPKQLWQEEALSDLETVLCQSLDVWTRGDDGRWDLERGDSDYAEDAREEISALLDSASIQENPITGMLAEGKHLCVIPIGEDCIATTTTTTARPDLVLNLATVSRRFLRQQEELHRLREENDFFLKQVSDDFEELTFLRSMAERLGLGDSTHSIEQLVTASLPELGKSTHSEELHFILNTPEQPTLLSSWHTDQCDTPQLAKATVLALFDRLCDAAQSQPVIKNGFESSGKASEFKGVRDYIAVPVEKSDSLVGWFLAINRVLEDSEEERSFPEWRLNQHEFGTSEASLLTTAAAMTASHASNLSLFQERETLLVNVVRTLVSAVEAKDQYTCGHSERVALYAKRLAQQVGYNEKACELLYLTGLLHDIGKIAINDAILNKPDRLTDEEFAEIQRHPDEGWKILHELKQLSYVLPGVLHHHERFDGKGYPDGLSKLDIPLDGRILAIADAYDAMTSNRAYRTGMPHDRAISILRDGAGTQWDPEVMESFLEIEDEITSIRNGYLPRKKVDRQPTAALPVSE